jgi:hypothetical protein
MSIARNLSRLAALLNGNGQVTVAGLSTGAPAWDASGNMALNGATPNTWNSTSRALQIGVTGAIRGRSDANLVNLMNNFYNDAGGTNRYINSDFATNYQQISGQHQWYTAASGTAGASVSFAQAMTLDANGNLVLGDTGAPYSSKIARVDNSNSAVQSVFVRNTNTGSSASCGYFFNASGNSWAIEMGSSAKNSNALTFSVDVVGTPTERMRLDTNGNLLVNTTTANGRMSVAVADGATNAFYAERTGASPAQFTVNFANQISNLVSSSAMTFSTNGFTERARIDTSGNFLLGTTSVGTMSGNAVARISNTGIVSRTSNSLSSGSALNLVVSSGGASFAGFLVVENVVLSNALVRTQTTYSVFGRGTSFTATSIASANGSSGGASFTVTCPSTGVISVTNTSGNTTLVNMSFFGSEGG